MSNWKTEHKITLRRILGEEVEVVGGGWNWLRIANPQVLLPDT
jgi:hypothetical protein